MFQGITVRRWAVLGSVALVALSQDAGALSFQIIDLGTLGGSRSYGEAVNDRGQVTGYSQIAGDGANHAFLYDGTSIIDLGTGGGTSSYGYGINNSGQITGTFIENPVVNVHLSHGFLYDGGGLMNIGSLYGGGTSGMAINDVGQIAGISGDRAFLYDNGILVDLGTLGGGRSEAYGINNHGYVTGYSYNDGPLSDHHAFVHNGAAMVDLGTLGPGNSVGLDINDLGWVTGISETSVYGEPHAFLHNGIEMIDLGLPGRYSIGNGINNLGQVVGHHIADFGQSSAFLYDDTLGGVVDLNELIDPLSGWNLYEARDISENGYITGHGLFEGEVRAFLLRPIPEPASITLLCLGLVSLAARKRRRGARD